MKKAVFLSLTGMLFSLSIFYSCKKLPAGLKENSETKDSLPKIDSLPKKDTLPIKDTLFKPDSLLNKDTTTGCITFAVISYFQSYSNPVWHPAAQILGFNWAPVSITQYGYPPWLRILYSQK